MRLAIFSFLLLVSWKVFAQEKKYDVCFYLGCGITGAYSPEVNEVKKSIENSDTNSMRKSLFDKSVIKQVCAAIAVEEFSKKGKMRLDEKDKKQIASLKKSKLKFYVCSGCTGHFYGAVPELLLAPEPKPHSGKTVTISFDDASFGRNCLRSSLGVN